MGEGARRTLRRRRLAAWAALTVLLTLVLAPPALAMSRATMTIDEDTGGLPTRFTLQATADDDGETASIDVLFPEGFDAEEAIVDITLLEGLKRIKTVYSYEVLENGAVRVEFEEPVPASSNIFMEVGRVVTPIDGGTYEIPLEYEVITASDDAEVRRQEDLTVTYDTPPQSEILSRWLANQDWVESWNSVKLLGIFLKPQQIVVSVPLLFKGWILSLELVAGAFPLAIVAGLLIAFMKMSKLPPVRWIASVYINVIRGTPLFLQIFVVFIGLRASGVRFPDFASAVAVLTFNSAAYLAEIFRAGIQSISRGQFEAASSLGMTYWQAMQHVIIPQTVRRVLPTMTSEFILLFKDTALFAAVGLFELMLRAQNHAARSGNLSAYVVAAVYYLIITIPLINLVGRLEARLAQSEGGSGAPPKGRPKRGELLGTGVPAPTGAPAPGLGPAVGSGPQVDFDHSAAKHESR
jgi:polar amino acid transport system substrate-binding protein